MRLLAVITNIIQVGIVLAIFIQSGLSLGGWVILGLFVLLLIALLNQIVLFAYAVNHAVHQPLVGSSPQPTKRRDLRIAYPNAPQPTVIIEEYPYSVLDISEGGLRFSVEDGLSLKKQISGRVSLLSGQSLMFSGALTRRENDEATIVFFQRVKRDLLIKESRMLQGIL